MWNVMGSIDAAEDARRHTNEDNEVIFSQYQGQIKTKTETAAKSLWNNIETSATIRKQWLESLDAQIIDLMRTSRDLDASRLEMSGRREKRGRVGILEMEVATQTTDILSKFESLIWLLEHGPEAVRGSPKIASRTSLGRIPLPALV
jgi:hypothetical protein